MKRREALNRTAMIMGTALTPGLGAAILNGCVPEVELDWSPGFLLNDEALVAGQIADRIIPRTDTPGALDAGVDQFIDKMLKEVYTVTDGAAYRDGIARVNKASRKNYSKKFTGLSPEEKDALLTEFEKDGERVFQITKELTLIGYFTSDTGMKANFEYRPIPGAYQDCTDYKTGDKVWIGNHVFNHKP